MRTAASRKFLSNAEVLLLQLQTSCVALTTPKQIMQGCGHALAAPSGVRPILSYMSPLLSPTSPTLLSYYCRKIHNPSDNATHQTSGMQRGHLFSDIDDSRVL